MPSFQRLLVLAVLGVTLCANAAVVPATEGTDLVAANENDMTPDYVTQAFAKVTPKKTTAKKTTAKKTTTKAAPKKTATPKKTTAKATPTVKKTTAKATPTLKKTTAKATPTVKKTTAKATPTLKKTTAKATPTVKKTASKAGPTLKKTTSKAVPTRKSAASKSVEAKPTAKPTSVKKTASTKPKSTKAKSTAKATGTKVSSAKPSSTSAAPACAYTPKSKKTRDDLHAFDVRVSNLIDLGGKEGRKGQFLGSSEGAEVYALTEWEGKPVSNLVVKLMAEQPENDQEEKNLDACKRYEAGPSLDCKSQQFALVMKKGEGTPLASSSDWKDNKQALMPKIAQQTAAMCVKWMSDYERMHTDLHPGNIMVTGSGTDLKVVDFVDLGAMLDNEGHGTPGQGAFAKWNTDVNQLAQTLETVYLIRS